MTNSKGNVVATDSTYYPGDNFTVFVDGLDDEEYVIEVEGATLYHPTVNTNRRGCSKTRYYGTNNVYLITDDSKAAAGTLKVWAGVASGYGTVRITEQIKLDASNSTNNDDIDDLYVEEEEGLPLSAKLVFLAPFAIPFLAFAQPVFARYLHRPLAWWTLMGRKTARSLDFASLTMGDTTAIVLYLLLNVVWTFVYADMHWRGLKHATGVCSIFNLMFTALPVTKTSIWMHTIGLSYERAVKFHRFLARYTVAIMWAHFALQAKHFGIGEVFSGSAGDHDTLSGILALVCFASMAFSAIEIVRRAKYEIFRYLHYLAILGVVFVFLHTPASVFLWGVVALYAIDHGLRW